MAQRGIPQWYLERLSYGMAVHSLKRTGCYKTNNEHSQISSDSAPAQVLLEARILSNYVTFLFQPCFLWLQIDYSKIRKQVENVR